MPKQETNQGNPSEVLIGILAERAKVNALARIGFRDFAFIHTLDVNDAIKTPYSRLEERHRIDLAETPRNDPGWIERSRDLALGMRQHKQAIVLFTMLKSRDDELIKSAKEILAMKNPKDAFMACEKILSDIKKAQENASSK